MKKQNLQEPPKNKRGTKKGSKIRELTAKEIDHICSDYYGAGMSYNAISEKYHRHYQTIYKHINANKHLADYYDDIKVEPLRKRQDMPELQRIEMITKDSMSVIEKTLAILSRRLEAELVVDDKGIITSVKEKLNLKDLATVLSEITPYVLEKKLLKPPTTKPENKRGKTFEMFKNQKVG